MFQLSKLDEGKIKPIFDAVQWGVMSRQIAQAKGLERFLKSNGYLDADGEPAAGKAKVINELPAKEE
jgi:hypothetical protein